MKLVFFRPHNNNIQLSKIKTNKPPQKISQTFSRASSNTELKIMRAQYQECSKERL